MAKNVQMAKATFANAQTGVGRVATQQATAASKSWRIPGFPLKSVGGREQVSLSAALSSRPICRIGSKAA